MPNYTYLYAFANRKIGFVSVVGRYVRFTVHCPGSSLGIKTSGNSVIFSFKQVCEKLLKYLFSCKTGGLINLFRTVCDFHP